MKGARNGYKIGMQVVNMGVTEALGMPKIDAVVRKLNRFASSVIVQRQ